MRKFNYLLLVFVFVSVLGMSFTAVAGPKDKSPKDFCEQLKVPGVPPELYGLCVAHDFGGGNPGGQSSCPCWTDAFIEEIYALADNNQLYIQTSLDDPDLPVDSVEFIFVDFQSTEQAILTEQVILAVDRLGNSCFMHRESEDGSTDADAYMTGLDTGELAYCATDVRLLITEFE